MGKWTRALVCTGLCILAIAAGAGASTGASADASTPRLQPAVVGGTPTTIGAVPWQVLLVINGQTECGGALVAAQWVLTAAHCVAAVPPAQIALYTGLTDQTTRSPQSESAVAQVIVAPGWTAATYAGDLALVQLSAPVAVDATHSPVALPVMVDASTWPAAGTPATISGWGSTIDGGQSVAQLRSAIVQVLTGPSEATCGHYGASYHAATHLCAGQPTGGVDSCQGDSGGPLTVLVNGVATLAGVVSSGDGCADPGFPGLYTRVANYLDWLREYLPLPQGLPSAPMSVTAAALSAGRILVTWASTAPIGDTTYTATVTPGGQQCTTSALHCVVVGISPGSVLTASVTATNALGTSPVSASSAKVTAVTATAHTGSKLWLAALARLAGIGTHGLTTSTPGVCTIAGTRLALHAPGTCIVQGGHRTVWVQSV